MIIKMKKATILISETKISRALERLKEIGLLHVKHLTTPSAESIDELNLKISAYEKAIDAVRKTSARQLEHASGTDYNRIADELLNLKNRINALKQTEKDLNDKIAGQQAWGDFCVQDIKLLNLNNVYVKLYMCGRKDFGQIDAKKNVKVINKVKGIFYIALICRNVDEELPFVSVAVPEKSLGELNAALRDNSLEIKMLEKEVEDLSKFKNALMHELRGYRKALELKNVMHGMAREEGFSYLQGYCPVTKLDSLEKYASENKWGLATEDLEEGEDAPVLLSDNFLNRIIRPVFSFMGTVPGYREFDISGVFLVFFSIFFAMLIGDAGYGLLFIAGTFTAHKKLKDVPKEVFILFYILSVSTLIWGAVTGTWFGYEKLARFPFVNILVIDSVNSFIDANMVNIIKLNFMIGLVQLCIAHLMIAFRERKSLKVLGQAGWVMVLFGLYFLAGKVVLNNPFPWIAKSLIFYGMLLVILFSVFNRKHIIKGFLAGLGELLNNFVSYFSHIVSYLRLFAVGYASVTIASSFNDMALSAGVGGVFATLGFALILLIGHGLNIALGGMAVVVHGIRLNMLEFSGHLNMQWSGSEYKPFSK